MYIWWIKVAIYLFAFLASMFGLNAIDFNRFVKQGKVAQAQVLYLVVSFALAYLLGSFMIALIYTLN